MIMIIIIMIIIIIIIINIHIPIPGNGRPFFLWKGGGLGILGELEEEKVV